jgi:hypothetical protein
MGEMKTEDTGLYTTKQSKNLIEHIKLSNEGFIARIICNADITSTSVS